MFFDLVAVEFMQQIISDFNNIITIVNMAIHEGKQPRFQQTNHNLKFQDSLINDLAADTIKQFEFPADIISIAFRPYLAEYHDFVFELVEINLEDDFIILLSI